MKVITPKRFTIATFANIKMEQNSLHETCSYNGVNHNIF
jgi:hypothetical protein